MILRELAISDFGIYQGRTAFDLMPRQSENYERPLVLFRGKNGVGKSTIMEAIRLCLHGSLALGNRVSRNDYLQYLGESIHRPRKASTLIESACVSVKFDHFSLGRKTSYHAVRSWRRQGRKIVEALDLISDVDPLLKLTMDQREGLLRELISPHAADIFFFDNEKLHARAEEGSSGLLTQAVGTLLGLDLVERLQRDLDTYLARQTVTNGADLNGELGRLQKEMDQVEWDLDAVTERLDQNAFEIQEKRDAIHLQEQRIASEGHLFSEQVTELRMKRERLNEEIQAQRATAQELTTGLMPFAIAPTICQQLARRIDAEEESDRRAVARRYVDEGLARLTEAIAQPAFWEGIGTHQESLDVSVFIGKIGGMFLTETVAEQEADGPVLHLSEQGRQTLRYWIAEALDEVPRRFCEAISRLNRLEKDLKQVERQLSLVPTDDVLKPLVEVSNTLHRGLGALEQQRKVLDETLRQLEYRKSQTERQIYLVREKLGAMNVDNDRVQLAVKSQRVLENYAVSLKREKTCLLEKTLVARFNDLCRKESFIEGVRIDPETFSLTLYRAGLPFDREKLSAGERQLLATAMMWALRDVSGLPLPVVIDTPFGRLDSDHHRNMINEYFPRAGHQVILLATNKEVDDTTLEELSPFLSHAYELSYDPETGSTQVERNDFTGASHGGSRERS